MTIDEAVRKVVECSRTVGNSKGSRIADLVELVFPDLELSPEDQILLIKAGLTQKSTFPVLQAAKDITVRTEPETATTDFDRKGSPVPVPQTVKVELERRALKKWEVTCALLKDRKFHVGGDLKPLLSITLKEWQDRQKHTQAIAKSANNFHNVHEHIIRQLMVFGSRTIAGLPENEQLDIAKMVWRLNKTRQHPALK